MSIDLPRFINIQSYGMIKTIIKAMYSAFISIALISIVLAGWTSYTFVFQSSKSSEIIKVIQDMYASQKSVVIDVIDLSKILIKGTSESIANDKNNLSVQTDLLKEIDKNSQLDDSLIAEDNGDNPLGIVIEPSLPEVSEKTLPEISDETLIDEQSEVSMNQMEIGMDMN